MKQIIKCKYPMIEVEEGKYIKFTHFEAGVRKSKLGQKQKPKKPKLPSLNALTKKADDAFQMAIRYRDGFRCITCGAQFPVGERSQLHAGHFISRKITATRWDEENVNAQCAVCNLKQSLADVEIISRYESQLKQKYGDDVVGRLFKKKHTILKKTRGLLLDIIQKYTDYVKSKGGINDN